jgi:beta-mannosidase
LLRQKEINFPQVEIQTAIVPVDGGFELSLSSDKFARAVFVSVEDEKTMFSDNFIDIFPGKPQKTVLKTSLTKEALLNSLKIKSLSESLVK